MNQRGLTDEIGGIAEGLVRKYEMAVRGDRPEHIWALIGEAGAIHIWARLSEFDGRHEWLGGIEVHSAAPFEYSSAEPDHERCWLLDKPCWHDGTSLGFSERVADALPAPYEPWKAHEMKPWHHGYVTGVLRSWMRSHFPAQGGVTEGGDPERGSGAEGPSTRSEGCAPTSSPSDQPQ